jgi:type IV secretion system protein VirB8
MARDAALYRYLEAGRSWDDDRIAQAGRSARRAWWVAGVACGCAVLALGALVAALPLKEVQPYLVRVDNATGIVDVVPRLTGGVEVSELVTRHLLTQYVIARERYTFATAEHDFDAVGAHQNAQLNQVWSAEWARSNPDSPLNRYRDGTTVRAQVRSISFLQRRDGTADLAQVRFLTALRPGGTGAEQVRHWIATVQYAYASPSPDNRARTLNPLGLRIVDYRREPEVVEAVEAPTVAALVPPAAMASPATREPAR